MFDVTTTTDIFTYPHSLSPPDALTSFSLIERRDAMEFFREAAADQFRLLLRKAWSPRTGSRVHHRTMTASLIDSRDFLDTRTEEHTYELQSLMRMSYAVFSLKKNNKHKIQYNAVLTTKDTNRHQ